MKINSWNVVNKLFSTLVNSVLLYSAEVWSIGYIDNVEKIPNRFYKKILCLPMNTPDCNVRLELGIPRLAVTVFKRILIYISKILKMSNDRYPRVCFLKLKDLSTNFREKNVKYNWMSTQMATQILWLY